MGFGAIPWDSVDRFAQREQLEGEDYDEFHYMVREMDHAWLEHHNTANKPPPARPEKPEGAM